MSRSDSSTCAPYRRTRRRRARVRARPVTTEDGPMTLPPLRRPRRLLHRGRRRPRPHPAQRPARLGRPGRRGAGRAADRTGLRLRQPRDPRPQAVRRSSRSRSSPPWRCARTWSRSTPAPTTSCGRGSTSTPWSAVRRRPGPAGRHRRARCWCGPAFDPGGSAIYRPLRGRFAPLQRAGPRERRPPRRAPSSTSGGCASTATGGYWDADRMHMGPAGHQRMAIEVLDTLGVEHALAPLDLAEVEPAQPAPPAARGPGLGARLGRALGAPSAHRALVG